MPIEWKLNYELNEVWDSEMDWKLNYESGMTFLDLTRMTLLDLTFYFFIAAKKLNF